jgi:GH18 family chitinase
MDQQAYDYAGSWLTWADNQANLYGGARTGVNTDSAVKHYTSSGATSSKINLGMPLYGRAFEDTNGIGQSYNGVRFCSIPSECNEPKFDFPLIDWSRHNRSWRLLLQGPTKYIHI